MSQTYTTTGIILKRRDFLENDKLFCLLTKDHGKLEIIAKGTKKITSKLNSYMEPFYLVKVMIAKGKKLDRLANCDLLTSYQNLRKDLFGFALINYLSEINDGLIEGKTETNDKLELLLAVLDILEKEIGKKNNEQLLMLINVYILKFLALLGYQPEIQRCMICHKGILLTKNIFDFSQGGIVCEECKKVCLIEDYLQVPDVVIKFLQLAQEKELTDFIDLNIKSDDLKKINQVVYKLLLVNLEKPIKSYEFLVKLS